MLRPEQRENLLPRGFRVGMLGVMASGKTTVAEQFKLRWNNAQIIPEEYMGNPFLREYYRGTEGTSFKSQLWFLMNRVNQLEGGKSSLSDPTSPRIEDPAFDNNYAFAKTQYMLGQMEEREWILYEDMFTVLKEGISSLRPDLYIALTAPTDVLMQRIRERGRGFEDVSEEYIGLLNRNVLELSRSIAKISEVFVIDTDFYGLEVFDQTFSRIETRVSVLFADGKIDPSRVSAPPIKINVQSSYIDFPPGEDARSRRFTGT